MTATTAHRPASPVRPRLPRPRRPLRVVGRHRRGARSAVTVADLMAVPHIAEPDAPLLEIVYRVVSLGQREIVVVSGQRPLGVITREDLAVLADPGNGIAGRADANALLPSRTPRLLPDQDLATAAATMNANDAEALPVVDHAGSLVGVLARRHVIAHLADPAGSADRATPLAAASSSAPVAATSPELERDDIYGPSSFPASDPPGTWAGRDIVISRPRPRDG